MVGQWYPGRRLLSAAETATRSWMPKNITSMVITTTTPWSVVVLLQSGERRSGSGVGPAIDCVTTTPRNNDLVEHTSDRTLPTKVMHDRGLLGVTR